MSALDWKKIPWALDYEVSSCGQVASWKPFRKNAPKPNEKRLLILGRDKDGYAKVTLTTNQGTKKYVRICRLVAELWHGPPPSCNSVVRHLDGNNQNNLQINLKWGTNLENSHDSLLHGTRIRGTKVNTCKLNEIQVIEVLHSELGHSDLAKKFGVTPSAIWHIRNKRSWTHVRG